MIPAGFPLLVKVQVSFDQPRMALVYDKNHTIQGQFPAEELPLFVLEEVKTRRGKAFYHARTVPYRGELKIEFGLRSDEEF